MRVKPLQSKKGCSRLLNKIEHDIGVPDDLISDQTAETTGKKSDWMKEARKLKIKPKSSIGATRTWQPTEMI